MGWCALVTKSARGAEKLIFGVEVALDGASTKFENGDLEK